MRTFVTGGTGLLGNTILRQLTEAGQPSLALVRGEPDAEVFAGIETELVRGDLTDVAVIGDAVSRCDVVIHSAGLIHLGWQRLSESMAVNRDGTATIAAACLRHRKRLVHIGTVNTLAVGSRDRVADETTPLDHAGGQVPCSYVTSKRAGVKEVLRRVDAGLSAVILHPGFMLGPWDWKPSSGRMIVEVSRVWRPIAPPGGGSVCDSRDVAAAAIRAGAANPESGRQYVLAGENWTYKKLWTEICTRTGQRSPMVAAGPAMNLIGAAVGQLATRVTGHEGDLNSAGVRMSCQFHWYDSSRAIAELDYRCRPASESLDDAVSHLRGAGKIDRD